MSRHVIGYKTALAAIATDERYSEVFRHGTLNAGIYMPHGVDDQDAHDQDEFYVVLTGSGFLVTGEEREPFGPGDLLFVPAGAQHRFEDFSADFAVWAIFCDSGV